METAPALACQTACRPVHGTTASAMATADASAAETESLRVETAPSSSDKPISGR